MQKACMHADVSTLTGLRCRLERKRRRAEESDFLMFRAQHLRSALTQAHGMALHRRLERKRRRAEERAALKTAKEAEERRQRQIAALGANLGLTDDIAFPARPGEAGGPCSDGARYIHPIGPLEDMAVRHQITHWSLAAKVRPH